MTRIARLLAAAALAGSAVTPAAAQGDPLPRRALLGVAMAPQAQQGQGAAITQLLPGATGERIGLRAGDVVVRAGGAPVAGPGDLAAYAGELAAGEEARLTVRRGGEELVLAGPAAPRPFERWENAAIDYGAVPFRGGHLRDILVVPAGAAADAPVVFLVPGFACASIEAPSPAHPYRALGAGLIERGIAYYRVEKTGMGDSEGTPECIESDYATELDGFRAAYRHLVEARGVAPERIFFFGHSLGGLQAPMLAAERAPRGVAAFGTVVRNWADYHRAVSQFQDFLMGGADPVETMREAESYRDLFRRFYIDKQSPAAIAASDPALARGLREAFAWDGGDNVFGRHWKFDQDLAGLPLLAAWRDADTNVLALYGEADLVALTEDDHELIAEVANHYRPGSGAYRMVPRTGHSMDLVGTPEELRARNREGVQAPPAPFNPEVSRMLAEWIAAAMARPPVAAR